jgi:D-tyrosyl-tRNA(Tyr) deacylase
MRAIVQRVRQAAVYSMEDPRPADRSGGSGRTPAAEGSRAEGTLIGRIGPGFALFLGVHVNDVPEDAEALAGRVAGLRVFSDEGGRLNRSILDVGGQVLSIPQFTLYADTRRGRRPSFTEAAPPERAEPLYERFNARLGAAGVPVVGGRFRTHMVVEIHNDGPVTILLETPSRPTALHAAPPSSTEPSPSSRAGGAR